MFYHVTLSQGRSDSFIIEADSKSDLISFFNTYSTAKIQSIKKIEYSSNLNINHSKIIKNLGDTYYKVEVFAKSENHAKIFELYNVLKTVTKESLKEDFKKLYIENEPIKDIYNIITFNHNEGLARDYDNLYQIVYKNNSKTHYIELESIDLKSVEMFFKNNIQGELLEIRKYLHKNNINIKDDKNYYKYVTIKAININGHISSFKLPKLKKSFNEDLLEQSIRNTFKVNNLPIKKIYFNYVF